MAVPVRSGPPGRSGFGVMGGPRGEAGPMRSGGPRVGAEIRCPGSPMSLAPMVANGGGWVIRFCRWPRALGPGPGSGTLGHRRARRPGWPPVAEPVRSGPPGRHRDLVPRVAAELGALGGQRRRAGDLVPSWSRFSSYSESSDLTRERDGHHICFPADAPVVRSTTQPSPSRSIRRTVLPLLAKILTSPVFRSSMAITNFPLLADLSNPRFHVDFSLLSIQDLVPCFLALCELIGDLYCGFSAPLAN